MSGLLRISHFLCNGFLKRPANNFIRRPRNRFCTQSPLDVNTNVAKDVILYKYDNARFFKVVNIFAVCQFLFWTYLSVFSFTTLRDAPPDPSKEVSWWRKINLGENKYRNGIAIFSFIVGYGILTVTWMYTLKSVRYLILHQGGQNISLVTYTPLDCKQSRTTAKSQLPLKVKGHYLHYILDMRGEFKNPTLFDHTAGLRRKWRTVE